MVDFNSIGALNANSQSQNVKRANEKLRAVVETLVSGARITRSTGDVASLALANLLQAQASGLKQVSSNVAQSSSFTQVADEGIDQIQEELEQLQSLTVQAKNPTLDQETRKQLNLQFQAVAREIDQIAENASFGGKKLLDGSLKEGEAISLAKVLGQENAENTETLEIGDLSTERLFEGRQLEIFTTDGAEKAAEAIAAALSTAARERAAINSFQESLNFLGASIDSAVINQEAARSGLEDLDFGEASTDFALTDLLDHAATAVAAQGNRLNPTLLKLVN